jgi:hypothetical protein
MPKVRQPRWLQPEPGFDISPPFRACKQKKTNFHIVCFFWPYVRFSID